MKKYQKIISSFTGTSLPPEMVKRMSAGGLVVGCLLLVVWSIMFRLSLVTEAQSQMHTPFSLSRQVASLEELWSEEESDSVMQEWAAVNAGSFKDYEQLVQWVTQMTAQAQALGLEVSYKIEEKSTPVQGVPEIHRIGMELTVQTKSLGQGYQHIMQFVRGLSEDTLRINFESMELLGTGQGVQKMEMRIHSFLQQAT
jgi:hypothetical protein